MGLNVMLLTELFDLDEAAGVGVVPANKKMAKDPRYANALTVDIHPGETQKQAAKFGNKTDKIGRPPQLRADGKVTEAAMSVGIQGRQPVSPGGRGLMAARWKYENIIDRTNSTNMQNAVERLSSKLDEIEKIDYASIDELMRGISVDFHIDPKDLHNAFIKKYRMIPDDYAKKLKKDRANRPKSV
jgi:hypothetical protein